ncbi:MAG: homoserine O-acetyltransferase/O-succinyltransferase family protein [Lachnospiraceae bacterium]
MGHPEYDRVTLDARVLRETKGKGLAIEPPKNYYPEKDDPDNNRRFGCGGPMRTICIRTG